jgi:predicted amidohydrolase YtcJ
MLITGARIYTADSAHPWAEAVAIQGNRIAYVGSEAEARAQAGADAEHIHVAGGLAVPGLNDSHIHVEWGGYNFGLLDLEGVETAAELQRRVREYAAAHPGSDWIEGYGLAYEWTVGLDRAEREVLDAAAGGRPILLNAMDTHSAWVNTEALRQAGIARGAAVQRPNEVVVDAATGLATGMLKERQAIGLVKALLGEPSEEQADEMLARAVRHLNSLGITSVQNMNGDLQSLARYGRLLERGDLTVRAGHYLNVREDTPRERLHEFAALRERYAGPWNRLLGIKLFIDGVVEGKTALMLEPYADGSGDTGVPDMDLDTYRDVVVAAHTLGMDVSTHAIGDRGVRLALDAYEAAPGYPLAGRAGGGTSERRHRIEHIEVIHPADIARFGRLGVTASMQPLHAVPTGDPRYTPWTVLVAPTREPYAFAWRSLLATRARLAFGSDWPIVTADVRTGLYTALTRQSAAGEPAGGWQPQQALTLAEALDGYTRCAAYAERQEGVKGMLRAGMLADVTVFAQDLFALRPAELRDAAVALTVVDGRVVYRASDV